MTRVLALCALFLVVTPPAHADVLDGERPVAAPFRAETVTGEALELEALLEKGPVLLDFWATWCKPCLASLPEIQAIHERYAGQGLNVVGVSIDGPRNYSKVRPFARRLGLEYAIVLDQDGSLQRRYQVRAIPTAILIGTDGRVLRVIQGFRPGESKQLEAEVRAALGIEDAATP